MSLGHGTVKRPGYACSIWYSWTKGFLGYFIDFIIYGLPEKETQKGCILLTTSTNEMVEKINKKYDVSEKYVLLIVTILQLINNTIN